MDVQRTIEAAVEKRTKNIFGPPVGKKLIAFIDDMNMPRVDEYGTQQPIALLKLLLERGGMYGRGKELFWKTFKDICECSHAYRMMPLFTKHLNNSHPPINHLLISISGSDG
jgi:hypothetical protein